MVSRPTIRALNIESLFLKFRRWKVHPHPLPDLSTLTFFSSVDRVSRLVLVRITVFSWRTHYLLVEDFTVSLWITNCLLVENLLPLCGDITVSLWRNHYILVESSMYSSPRGYLTVSLWRTHCLFSWRTYCNVFVVFWVAPRFCPVIFWIAPLGPISLVMPTLLSDFIDSCKYVVFRWISLLGPIFLCGSDATVRLL